MPRHPMRVQPFSVLVVVLLVGVMPTVATAASIDGAVLNLEEAGLTLRAPGGSWSHESFGQGLAFRCNVAANQWARVTIVVAGDVSSPSGAAAAMKQALAGSVDTAPLGDASERRMAGVTGWYAAYFVSGAEVHVWQGWRGGYLVTLTCHSPTSKTSHDTTFFNNVAGSMRADGTWRAPADPASAPAPSITSVVGGGSDSATARLPDPEDDDGASSPDGERDEPTSSGGGSSTMMILVVGVLVGGVVAVVIVINNQKGGAAKGAASRGRGRATRSGGSGGSGSRGAGRGGSRGGGSSPRGRTRRR